MVEDVERIGCRLCACSVAKGNGLKRRPAAGSVQQLLVAVPRPDPAAAIGLLGLQQDTKECAVVGIGEVPLHVRAGNRLVWEFDDYPLPTGCDEAAHQQVRDSLFAKPPAQRMGAL
jgi:hypothetical protein